MNPEHLADLLERARQQIAKTAGKIRSDEGFSAHLLAAECGTAANALLEHARHLRQKEVPPQ